MKFIKYIILTPKRIFSKKDRSPSGSTHKKPRPCGTPTSVLRPERSGDWSSDNSFSGGPFSELSMAFKLIDKDNDGMVSRCELEALLNRIGGAKPPSREVVETMLSEVVDEDDDDISVEELTNRLGSACEPPAEDEELREVFLLFDADGDGKITAEELLGFFATLGDERCTLEECRRMIAAVDRNGDGFVCFEDFSRMMDLSR